MFLQHFQSETPGSLLQVCERQFTQGMKSVALKESRGSVGECALANRIRTIEVVDESFGSSENGGFCPELQGHPKGDFAATAVLYFVYG